ncbi:alkaline phosphatase family protein [Aurantiacibacter flavus]|uniref:Alkaline phosphatase family protein n=1 Tax=Aurantiacibacter flavus TaxID=3145232 RepID=A0ABV0CV82_9SPHN
MPSPRLNLAAKLLGAVAAVGLAGPALAQNGAAQPPVRHVIFVGVDGMSPDGINNADTPVMDQMIAEGGSTMHARSVLPTSSSPNWASMLTGVDPSQHGVTSNDWRVGDFTIPASVTGSGNFFPSIFQILHDQHPEWEVGSIYDWDGFGNLYDHRFVDLDVDADGHAETAAHAADYIRTKRPQFLFVHLDQADHAGHADGHGTPEYYAAVESADAEIGLIRQAIEQAGIAEETVIIVSSDHGGVGKGHGGESLAELEIPWIAAGAGVARGRELEMPISTYDLPATVAWLLGIERPYAWIGRPVRAALASEELPKQTYKVSSFYAPPVISPLAQGNDPAGGLFVEDRAELTIANPNPLGEVRYTLDGTNPTATSPLYQGPVAITQSTIVRSALYIDGTQASMPTTGYFRVLEPSDEPRGLSWNAYLLPEDPVRLPVFDELEPVASGVTHEVSLSELDLPRDNAIAVTFDGFIDIPATGTYDFYLASDDGSKLYIDGKTVVDNDGDHGVIMKAGSAQLEAGRHAFRAEWFNGGGGAWVGAWFQGPGIVRQFLDPNLLSPR